jgi:hypothetical protein
MRQNEANITEWVVTSNIENRMLNSAIDSASNWWRNRKNKTPQQPTQQQQQQATPQSQTQPQPQYTSTATPMPVPVPVAQVQQQQQQQYNQQGIPLHVQQQATQYGIPPPVYKPPPQQSPYPQQQQQYQNPQAQNYMPPVSQYQQQQPLGHLVIMVQRAEYLPQAPRPLVALYLGEREYFQTPAVAEEHNGTVVYNAGSYHLTVTNLDDSLRIFVNTESNQVVSYTTIRVRQLMDMRGGDRWFALQNQYNQAAGQLLLNIRYKPLETSSSPPPYQQQSHPPYNPAYPQQQQQAPFNQNMAQYGGGYQQG